MQISEFRKHAHELVDWMANYLQKIEDLPVKKAVKPGEIIDKLPAIAPSNGQPFGEIMQDFKDHIIPNVVHWQHPGFMAYFPANSSPPSILAEMLTATLGNQCMIWDTSPAAAELEERMMEWLSDLLNLPSDFVGVIQDTASIATLSALLTAREKVSEWRINNHGFDRSNYRVYASEETHSSIEKGVKIAGFGKDNFIKIKCDESFRLDPEELDKAIKSDLAAGMTPTCVVATMGTTGVTAIDPLYEIALVCQKYGVWLHVDAAYAGTALVLEEYQWMAHGLELADSFVFNPHKWMFTNFDCTAYYVKDKDALIRTFEILPEYLKYDDRSEVNDYRDWGIPLGRRFRSLKLWFVLRSYGKEGIRAMIRNHLDLAERFAKFVEDHEVLVLMAPRELNLICFRYQPQNGRGKLDEVNKQLLSQINSSGKFYVTHTKINGKYSIRVVTGQTYLQVRHLASLETLINQLLSQF